MRVRGTRATGSEARYYNGPMNRALTVARVVLGILLVLQSGVGVFLPLEQTHWSPALIGAWRTLASVGPLVAVAHAVELVAGCALAANRFVPLALSAYLPVLVSVLLLELRYDPTALATTLPMAAIVAMLLVHHRERFRPLLVSR